MSLMIATCNMGDGADHRKYADLTRLAAEGADVICVQEGSDRRRVIGAWARDNGWLVYWGDGTPGAAAAPILWRPGVHVTATGTREAVESTWVGEPGAGPERVKRKVVNRIRVHRGRRRVHILNTHLLPSATRALPNRWRRVRHYARHIGVVAAMVADRRRVVVVGDFNAPPTYRLLRPLRRLGLRQWVRTPTHGNRTIDHVWTKGLRVTDVRAVPTSSDHYAVLATVAA